MAKGYAVDFLSMSLHAVSTDPEAYPSPCLYVQVFTCAAMHYCSLILSGRRDP